MKTEVSMIRFLDGTEIRQKSKSGYFCLTDMMKVINKKRILDGLSATSLGNYFNAAPTKEFLKELAREKGIDEKKLCAGNRKAGTWAHPYVLIDLSLWGCPSLKVRVYDWIYDSLLQRRNNSGDAFKEMNMVLDRIFKIGGKYWNYTKVAVKIAEELDLKDIKNRWQYATEHQLKLRDILQREIIASALYGEHNTLEECVDKALSVFRMR